MSTKVCSRFSLLCLDPELFAKIKKDLISAHSQKPDLFFFYLNKIKISAHLFTGTFKQETCAKFQ